ncbi:MAG: hypothetical protein HYY10_04240 [Candidatus Liptonbacteria bacterium]|nr:hypothetical protein [Candidatus Liptonbacteria bacterium]
MNRTMFAAVLLCVIAFLLQIQFGGNGFGFENAVLVTLIALACVRDVLQIVFLGIIAAWFLNWQPGVSAEVVLLVAIPVAVSLLKGIFPGLFLVSYWAAVVLGVGLWYVAADFRLIVETPSALMNEIALGCIWAAACIVPIRILARDSR